MEPLARADSSFVINSRGTNCCKRVAGWTDVTDSAPTGSGAGGAAAGAPTAAPQLKQNLALGGRLVLQLAHVIGIDVPQLKQKRAPSGLSVLQAGQFIWWSLGVGKVALFVR